MPVVLLGLGSQLLQALENGVSQYPRTEGRFPQVSGVSFGFDPTRPPGQRVGMDVVRVQGECLQLDKVCLCFLGVVGWRMGEMGVIGGREGWELCVWGGGREEVSSLNTIMTLFQYK